MTQFIHSTHCYIPAPLAAVLDASPDLVAPMVQAFYYRDPVDLKACVTFKHFRPGTRVVRQVKMTKCLYAQLMQQQFTPDRRSGYALPDRDHPSYKSHDLGVKLAHGAEILCSKCGHMASHDYDLSHDLKWQTFLDSLKEKGYFNGEIEGSLMYKKLLDDAKKFFQTSASLQAGDESSPGRKILQVLKAAQYDVEDMRKQEKDLKPPDDDSWLALSPDQLDDLLNEAYQDVFQNSTTTDLGKMAHNMKAFVNKISSHEGAEFPGPEDDEDVTIDPDGFIQTMHKMFDFKDEKLTSSEDDMSEYGSEDDLDCDLGSKSKPPSSTSNAAGCENGDSMDLGDMKSYMEQMDRELSHTEMGKSFVTEETQQKPVPPPRNKKKNKKRTTSSKTTLNATQNGPNSEQNQTNSTQSKPKVAPKATLSDEFSDIDDLDEDFEPVNVNLNLVKNLLESHSSQHGLAGPTSNILGSMGMKLPQDSGQTE